jgi:dienelactone hydrolase
MNRLHDLRSRSLALVSLALLLLPVGARANEQPTETRYTSQGCGIRVTRFNPADAGDRGPRPAVILLHGLDGAEANRTTYEGVATSLTKQGYVVFFLSYFDAFVGMPNELAHFQANVKQHLPGPDCPQRRRLWRSFERCLGTIGDGVRHVREQPGVDADRVGIFGFSLGGFLAVSTATQKDLKIRTVVEMFGGLPREYRDQATALPPTLVIHGDQDTIVPVEAARDLEDSLKANQRPHAVCVYPGCGHVFVGRDGKLAWWPALDAQLRAIGFLKKHLG